MTTYRDVVTGQQAEQREPAADAEVPSRRGLATSLGVGILAGMGLAAAVRRLGSRTGVTDEEIRAALPGDEVIPRPMVEWTRGVSVAAPPETIWPWLVQQGYDRIGWYTPRWVDRIVNPVVFGTRAERRHDQRIVDEYQTLEAGDIIADGPEYGAYFRVIEVRPAEAIVYHSIRHPWRPHPVDPESGKMLAETEERLRRDGVYLDFTWTFVLSPVDEGRSRLLVRTRANYAPKALAPVIPFLGLFDATYGTATLRAIASRAESAGPEAAQESSRSR